MGRNIERRIAHDDDVRFHVYDGIILITKLVCDIFDINVERVIDKLD